MDFPGHSALHTHEVANQPAPRRVRDFWAEDLPLREQATVAGANAEALSSAGCAFGSETARLLKHWRNFGRCTA